MFKLESYITPIILSYVDKYIKNFRTEDSQVSLWGGDALFQNLDLRLDVLEQELQLPFSLLSGHIHELLIHVPWTKLASEPINITINTIECVLKLREAGNSASDNSGVARESKRKQSNRKQDMVTPSGYVQSLINKIVNNITINCNNLILKYVEEDIVVSVNIKLLTFESASENWQAAYTELTASQRKLITLSDLTVCIDKRNAAGKIEVYQEPVLYRCFIEMRLLRNYRNSNADKAANTRLDIYCNKMEFSMTEQQIPMLMRMINLLLALHQRQLKNENNFDQNFTDAEDGENNVNTESWAGWAWSFASNIFPSEQDSEFDDMQFQTSKDTLQLGMYIDHAILTFKVSESFPCEKGYYKSRKLKYQPLLCLQLNGCFTDTVSVGVEWCSVQMGVADAVLLPQGYCSCGIPEIPDDSETKFYLKTGKYSENYKLDSLFDSDRIESKSQRKIFIKSWDLYLSTITEAVMVEKTPAIALDYLYHLEVPDDYTSENLSELGSNLEYSNLPEKAICRVVNGPLVVEVSSGLIHRASTLQQVMEIYDYAPYKVPPPDPELSELLPPSEDDYDALNNDIPTRIYQLTFLKPVFEFQLMDHPKFIPTKENLFRRPKKLSNVNNAARPMLNCPKVTLECETVDFKMCIPMYPKRLVYTTCQLPHPPVEMFNACYSNTSVKIFGVSSQMVFNSNKRITVLIPFNMSYNYKSITFPKYWINPDTPHEEFAAEIDSITITATKAKLMVIVNIIEKFIILDPGEYRNSIFTTSLLQDAASDSGMVVLELFLEHMKWGNVCTASTVVHNISLDCLKAFVLEPNEITDTLRQQKSQNKYSRFVHDSEQIVKEPNQVLIISGPELSDTTSSSITEELILLTITMQYPRNIEKRVHPPLLFFNLSEIKICFDPLLFRWLLYFPKYVGVKAESWNQVDPVTLRRSLSEMSGSMHETPRRANTPHESIHSSSDRDHKPVSSHRSNIGPESEEEDLQDVYYELLLKWYPVWTNAIIFGDIAQCTVYFPTQSLSAVGSRGIQEAVEISLTNDPPPEIMVLKLPNASVRSAAQRQSLIHLLNRLPIKLPENMWIANKQSFPWSISIWNFCCYTLQNESKLYFLKPVSGNATIGLSAKYRASKENLVSSKTDVNTKTETKPIKNAKNVESKLRECQPDLKSTDNINALSVCVHIDNTPIEISLSEIQVYLITSILHGLYEVSGKLFPPAIRDKPKVREIDFTSNIFGKSRSRSQSPTFYKEDFPDVSSERTPTSLRTENKNIDEDPSMKFTVWVQWTITRLRMKLYAHNMETVKSVKFPYLLPPDMKFVFDMEDIMSSLDLQQVYMKLKSKIVTTSVHHFIRKSSENNWEPGPYLGLVMRGREEFPTSEKQDDFGFMSITVTRAKCGHVHNKWGTSKKHRLAEMKVEQQLVGSPSKTRYISELVATIQPIDLVLSPNILRHFYLVLEPLSKVASNSDHTAKSTENSFIYINNNNLPLAYLDCNGLRILILSSELPEIQRHHDVCIIEIESISLIPTAENPICRIPIRPDIYQHAAQTRILNVPGSEIEDRQYQLNINSLSVNTGLWSEFSLLLSRNTNVATSLHTMNENPALEWNNLEGGRNSLIPNLSLLPIIQKFNMSIVMAPAIVCRKNIIICGCSMEVNCVSDIEIHISLYQISLISSLLKEFNIFFQPVIVTKRPKFVYLDRVISSRYEFSKSDNDLLLECTKDSGVECTDANSEFTAKTKESVSRSGSMETDRRNILKIQSDSKISEVGLKNVPSGHSCLNYCPVDILITGGQIMIFLFNVLNQDVMDDKHLLKSRKRRNNATNLFKEDTGYEASEEGSVDEVSVSKPKVQPLLFILLSQPNVFFSKFAFGKKINVSCFDVCIKTNESQFFYTGGIPTQKDYSVNVLETKTGVPNLDTGIPPAFITVKWLNTIGKSPSLDVDFGRPIKISYSISQMNHLLDIKNQLLTNFQGSFKHYEQVDDVKEITEYPKSAHISTDTYTKFKMFRKLFWEFNDLRLNFSQIAFSFKTEYGPEMTLSFGKLYSHLSFSNRPENLSNMVHVENFTMSTTNDGSTKILINPWSFTFNICLLWESWQNLESDPQIQLSIKSDCLVLDIGPEQMKCIDVVMKECNELKVTFSSSERVASEKHIPLVNTERDQHYKDDLRTGAFQFVDAIGSADEMPLPYQVMFWTQPIAAMAWRYPQPRKLMKVRVFPVPFKVNHGKSEEQQVLCSLQYWSDCQRCYIPYAMFHLSESEMYHLELPKSDPQPAISCAWRVVLNFSGLESSATITNPNVFISPRALAVCLRIDSYFNPVLVPRIQLALNISSINVCFYNQFNKNMAFVMPEKLKGYTPDGLVPDIQCFMMLNFQNSNLFIASWYSEHVTIDFKTTISCDILDYASLTLQPFVERCLLNLRLNFADCINFEAVSESINIKLNAAVGHTLAVATQVWLQNYQISTINDPPDMIILTRYVICNDTNVKLRFGQIGTDEDILLASRFLHLYCFRSHKHQRKIKVGMEQNGWVWSEPLDVDTDKSIMIEIKADYRFILMMTVKSLSRTQKQIIFSGQLVVCNMLLDHFELKLVSLASENKDEEFRNAQTHVVCGRSTAPSFVVNLNKKLALRLKFFSLESAWSGDIPLEENVKCSQPWLVKIPLQERGQFLSIWCRVIVQQVKKYPKILVMLWPLFMVRSSLPISSKIYVETPSLNVRLETSLRGRGELQQLYCPGTIDHSHNLAFQFDADIPGPVPHVPVNYTLIDHKQFFKRIEKENILEIIEFLKDYDKSVWPYIDSNLDRTDWIIEEQPFTHVQVRYKNACQYSSSLLVELLPWCMLLNTLGCPIRIILNGTDLCSISHHGVVAPPKLENTFNIAVKLEEKWNISPVLQLARPDWSQSFYMPKINGLIPLEGNIKVSIKCGPLVCLASITSSIFNEIRILQVQSSHVITNYTELQLEIICLILPDNNRTYDVPNRIKEHSITLSSHLNMGNIGVPLVKWFAVDDISDSFSEYSLHIIVSYNNGSAQTCPIRVDKALVRKNICLFSNRKNIPLIILAQEHKGQIFLSLHHDIHPQLLINNKCNRKIFCTECDADGQPVFENACFNWKCGVEPDTEMYYTMPEVTEKFPELSDNFVGKLVFAVESEDFEWSHTIDINNYNEQYLRIPNYEDVKISIKKLSYTVLVTIDSATRAEISARDIRRRLLLQSSKYNANTSTSTSKQKPESANDDILEQPNKYANKNLFDRHSISESQVGLEKRKMFDANSELSEYKQTSKMERKSLNVAIFVKNVIVTLTIDNEDNRFDQIDVTTVICEGIAFTLEKDERMDCCISIADIQCDNQLFRSGFFDFPVVLVGEKSSSSPRINTFNKPVLKLIEQARSNALIKTDLHVEIWIDNVTNKQISEIREVQVNVRPLLAYIEDTYITKLMDYISDLFPTHLVMWTNRKQTKTLNPNSGLVGIPEHLSWESTMLARPLILRSLSIEPVSILLSVHSSVKLYIALDRSPLQFSRFERKNLTTTPYRLGHSLTMHYLSGAIFGAGWVVGSLELLGSPSGLARTLGSGLRDFVSLPYHGLIQGPWAFLIGITHGSASLMRHITAGTLDSVTKLAASVARNLDRLTLDEEHQKRTEELRRQRPQGLAQGFMQGLTGLGISLLGAVGGIAHHPLQSVMNDGASPRGFATGVGLGLVGVITKPLSGAAELVALTGQGLLQGAGWNPMPTPRANYLVQNASSLRSSILKYKWKFLQNITLHTNLLAVLEAEYSASRVVVILTFEALIIIDVEEDVVLRVVSINEITGVKVTDDNSVLCVTLMQPVRPVNQNVDPCDVEMDPVCRARVADYVKNASGLVQISSLGSTSNHSDIDVSPIPSQTSTPMQYSTVQPSITFIVNPQNRNYFCNLLTLVQQQSQDNIFKVL